MRGGYWMDSKIEVKIGEDRTSLVLPKNCLTASDDFNKEIITTLETTLQITCLRSNSFTKRSEFTNLRTEEIYFRAYLLLKGTVGGKETPFALEFCSEGFDTYVSCIPDMVLHCNNVNLDFNLEIDNKSKFFTQHDDKSGDKLREKWLANLIAHNYSIEVELFTEESVKKDKPYIHIKARVVMDSRSMDQNSIVVLQLHSLDSKTSKRAFFKLLGFNNVSI